MEEGFSFLDSEFLDKMKKTNEKLDQILKEVSSHFSFMEDGDDMGALCEVGIPIECDPLIGGMESQ